MAPTSAKTAFHLYLLGSFRLERDARVIRFPTRKIESLLAYLTIFPQPHPREKRASIFWGDSTDAQARHSLRTALLTLYNKLGVFLADREIVQLNPDFPSWAGFFQRAYYRNGRARRRYLFAMKGVTEKIFDLSLTQR